MSKALIVEDDKATTHMYNHVLTKAGLEVYIATDGEQAITLLTEQQPDIVFLDMRLPMIDGKDVLNYIAENDDLQPIHVVIVTAGKEFAQLVDLVPSAEYLQKPIRPDDIREIIQQQDL